MIKSKRSFPMVPFVVALVTGLVLGVLAQTWVNFVALQKLGVSMSVQTQFSTMLHDLLNFSPVYLVIFGSSFVVSQAVALLFTRLTGAALRTLWCTGGAALGLWATFKVVDMLVPMPVLIASTRSVGGLLAMLATAAVSGALFSRLSQRKKPEATAAVLALLIAAGVSLPAQEALAQKSQVTSKAYKIETVVTGLENPWSIAFLPDGRSLVTEKQGRLRIVSADSVLLSAPVLGMPAVFHAGQAGLFDVLPATDFAKTNQLFLSYACGTRSANHTCVASANLNNNRLENLKEVFRSDFAKAGSAHYGGRMAWLPDNTLVLTLGDGYSYREEAQNLANHMGKIIRIHADGSVPKDNPFVGKPGVKPEIYSYGHRNVQGLFYDADTRRLIAHEHGPRGGDEVNIIKPGVNYGWPKATYGIDYTGARISPFTEYEGTQQPEIYWVPSIAPSGMTLYSGNMFPQWKGSLLVGALKAQQVSRVDLKPGKAAEQAPLFKEVGERIRDVRSGPDGAIYLLTDNSDGRVLRISRP